jgi:hypothetical protein
VTHEPSDEADSVVASDDVESDDGGPDDVASSNVAPGAQLRGVRALTGDDFSFREAIGGVRGLIESTTPGLVFVVVYLLVRDLTPALIASLAVAATAVAVRLVQRTPTTQAFSGIGGIVIGAIWAWRTGEPQDFYTWGLWVNLGWCLGALISILVRWPVVGVVVSLLRGHDMSWRSEAGPAASHLRRRYTWATWLWVGVFGGRLAVQVPLWMQGEAALGWLGTAKLVMGVPLFAVALWITWLLVGSRAAREEPADPRPTQPR